MRVQAVSQIEKGARVEDVADALGLNRSFLNPDEWVPKFVRADRVGTHVVTGPDQFKSLAVAGLRRLQRLPGILRGFFADSSLAYINTAA